MTSGKALESSARLGFLGSTHASTLFDGSYPPSGTLLLCTITTATSDR